jgi:hypothetical protein
MTKRPRSVKVISWIFIALGITYPLLLLQTVDPQAPPEITTWKPRGLHEYLLSCIPSAIAIVLGLCLLRGLNWARWFLVLWFGYGVVHSLARDQARSFSRILLFGVLVFPVLYLLFRPKATAFFRPKPPEEPDADDDRLP